MTTILDIKHAETFTGFDFGKMHEGIVVENSMFETKGSIYVTIPELTLTNNDSTAYSVQSYIDSSKVMSDTPDLKYRTEVNHVNYIECFPIVLNNFTIGHLKPQRGNTVMVFFLNGDTKLPYYFNAHPLKEGEDIMNSSNEKYVEDDDWGYYRIIKLMKDSMVGPDVHKVGNKLSILGYNVRINPDDGSYYYDQQMYTAVKSFQRRIGITEDGEVGPVTFKMLMRARIPVEEVEETEE